MRTSPVQELKALGQSLWLDNIRRQLVTSGELARLREEGVSGVTSNPTIFDKAVSGSTDYTEALVRMVGAGYDAEHILWELMLEDIRAAADVFRPVYDETVGADGYVSIEVSPRLAMDTEGTVAMARDLFQRAGRPNVMVKIPGTKPGLPAIRQMLGEGVNINVTLIFSTERYDEVVDAFMSGLEDLKSAGGDPSRVSSVASFFVSRVDTKVDKLLDARIEAASSPAVKGQLARLLGKAGIELQGSVRALEAAAQRSALGVTARRRRPAAAMSLGEHVDQGSPLSRHDVRRGADRPRHSGHYPPGYTSRLQGAWRGASKPGR